MRPPVPMTLLDAIATQEGFYEEQTAIPSLSQRNHNPGNIVYGLFAAANGALPGYAPYAKFPDDATGFAALKVLLSGPAYKGKTVEIAINRYCPPPDGSALTDANDPDVYVKNVCAWCQCTPDTVIDGLLGS